MAEEKKRFPWWLVARDSSVILSAAIGLIETVGLSESDSLPKPATKRI
jgi:hypothetical protein